VSPVTSRTRGPSSSSSLTSRPGCSIRFRIRVLRCVFLSVSVLLFLVVFDDLSRIVLEADLVSSS
jgi:hypothetical protein